MTFPLLFLQLFPLLIYTIHTIGLNLLGWIIPKRDTILRPFNEIFCIKVGAESFGKDVEVNVVILKHIKKGKLSDGCHDILNNIQLTFNLLSFAQKFNNFLKFFCCHVIIHEFYDLHFSSLLFSLSFFLYFDWFLNLFVFKVIFVIVLV